MKYILFTIFVFWNIIVCFAVDFFGGPNIAFSKSTYQYPGVLGDGKSNKAVDGDTTHSGSVTCTDCAHTDLYNTGATETWWRVDLGDTYRLTGIKIYNRDRRPVRARLSGMVITGSTSIDGNGTELHRDQSNVANCSGEYTNQAYPVCQDIIMIPISSDQSWRYVKISTTDYLMLCEVEVFAEVCSSPAVTHEQASSQSKTIYKSGDVVTITCNVGYAPSSLDTTCQSDRSWVPEPSCRYLTCVIPSIHNGFYTMNGNQISTTYLPYGATIQPHCSQPGHTTSPSTARTCQEDERWSGSDPSCVPIITCNSLPTLANGYYDDGSNNAPYSYNDGISPECNDGYYLNGSSLTRRCIADNTWSGDDPTCLPSITCSSPSTPNNGRYNGSQSTYDYGTILLLTCDTGYCVSNTVDIKRKCVGHNSWNGYDLTCQRIICFQPGTISNGRYNKNESSYDFGSEILPICDQGYTISNNVIERVCEQLNKWSGDEPACVKVSGEPQTQSVVIVATVGWTLFGVLLLLNLVYCVRKKVRSKTKSTSYNGSSVEANQAECNYTDLEERSRPSSNYTELQTRNDDYSSTEASGHAYVNTQMHG